MHNTIKMEYKIRFIPEWLLAPYLLVLGVVNDTKNVDEYASFRSVILHLRSQKGSPIAKFQDLFCQFGVNIIRALRPPKGPPGGASYSYRTEMETHELIFLWLLWPAALLVSAYARRRPRRSRATWRPYSK